MAVTKLMHMKQGPKCTYEHLRNAINYILKPEKTKGGMLVGGNSGIEKSKILKNFLETKHDFEKMEGRQGYHFVISFLPNETDEKKAYKVIEEFCREYLGDNYDYVFSIHTDKEHMHGHIIFNSVSHIGYKYHYKKGDWKKYIQPITDRICREHGLQELTFEDERVGVSYASWYSKQENGFDRRDIFRADIDYAIQYASSYEEFLDVLRKMGYEFNRSGKAGGKEDYISLRIKGMQRFRRTSRLGPGYSVSEIKDRIVSKDGNKEYEELERHMKIKADGMLRSSAVYKSSKTYMRMYQAVNYYRLPNPYAVPAYRVRKDMLNIRQLCEGCRYLKKNNINTIEKLKERQHALSVEIEKIKIERKTMYMLRSHMSEKQIQEANTYAGLKKELNRAYKNGDDRFEKIEDQMRQMEMNYPEGMLLVQDKIEQYNFLLSALRAEKKVVERLVENEADVQISSEPKVRKNL